jgi:hypothetical protein
MRAATVALFAFVGVSTGCLIGGEQLEDHPCPPEGTPWTYESFGAPFLARNCERCHAANAPERNGAPPNVTFDTHEDVQRWRDLIFANAADDNTAMPPGPDDPSLTDRRALADWLACGAP